MEQAEVPASLFPPLTHIRLEQEWGLNLDKPLTFVVIYYGIQATLAKADT